MGKTVIWRWPIRRRRAEAPAIAVLIALLCGGCANPGPPKPPSLRLPAPVKDLGAERVENRVRLRWTTPSQTTDGLPVKGQMTAQICRVIGTRPGTPAGRPAACAPILRLAVAPGASEVVDLLSPSLQRDPPVLLTYFIQIFNAGSRSAGNSTAAAFAAGGAAPTPIEGLKAVAGERGVILEWETPSAMPAQAEAEEVEFTRTTLASGPAEENTAKPKSHAPSPASARTKPSSGSQAPSGDSEIVRLRTPHYGRQTPHGPPASGGLTDVLLDTNAKMGFRYSYAAQQVRLAAIGGHSLEMRSDPSAPVALTLRDTFPPARPTGLATISGAAGPASPASAAAYIDLSWEPNTEPDLAGYLVYRQQADADGSPPGPMVKLTQSPVAAPAYRDVAVVPGRRYIYQVTAVDASGNESAPSAQAQEVSTTELNPPK